jgi:hypothetical protein
MREKTRKSIDVVCRLSGSGQDVAIVPLSLVVLACSALAKCSFSFGRLQHGLNEISCLLVDSKPEHGASRVIYRQRRRGMV